MAMMRLSEGWTLTSGVWPPFLLPEPTDIASALREQGILESGQTGLSALYEQWIYAQRWVYALEFDAPGEDERFAIRFEALAGAGEIHVNGRLISRFAAGETTVDVTGAVEPERNRLEVAFDPALWRGAPHGILGPVWLRTTSFLSLGRVRALERDGAIRVRSNLTAHSAGRYLFRYTVSLDDEAVLETGVYERLRAADAAVEHALELPSPVSWDGEKYYTVRLSIERSGVGCDMVRVNVAWARARRCASRCCPPTGCATIGSLARFARWALRRRRKMAAPPSGAARRRSAHRGAAARAARFAGRHSGRPVGRQRRGAALHRTARPGCWPLAAGVADPAEFCEEDDLLALGVSARWRASRAASGSGRPARRSGARRAAPVRQSWKPSTAPTRWATRPGTRACRASCRRRRRGRALIARKDGRPLAVRAAEGAPACASHALIEYSARSARRAALRQAWDNLRGALAGAPFSAEAPLSVWMFSDGRALRVPPGGP